MHITQKPVVNGWFLYNGKIGITWAKAHIMWPQGNLCKMKYFPTHSFKTPYEEIFRDEKISLKKCI